MRATNEPIPGDPYGRSASQRAGAYSAATCAWIAELFASDSPAPALAFAADSPARRELFTSIDRLERANAAAAGEGGRGGIDGGSKWPGGCGGGGEGEGGAARHRAGDRAFLRTRSIGQGLQQIRAPGLRGLSRRAKHGEGCCVSPLRGPHP